LAHEVESVVHNGALVYCILGYDALRADNAEMADLDFGYSQSKWVAEQAVYAAGRQGMKTRVYRPSLISAATKGAGGRDDIAVRFLAFMIRNGVAVNARSPISFLPAAIVADNTWQSSISARRRPRPSTSRSMTTTA
jgi:thioester reductase-like protein